MRGTRGGFLFVELGKSTVGGITADGEIHDGEDGEGTAVEVLRVGEFVDRNGKDVVITGDDLEAFVANFVAGEAGQEVPIDIVHQRGEAGGWVRRVWREGDTLLASVDWNELGRKLVGERIYRYLSATIDLGRKVIKSISLVNFPAVKGLRPVELGEGVYGLEEAGKGFGRGRVVEVVLEVLAALGFAGMGKSTADGEMDDGNLEENGKKVDIAIGDFLQSRIHKAFTNIADDLASAGYVTVEERIQLSHAIGEALGAFRENTGEVGAKVIQIEVEGPQIWFSAEGGGESANQRESESANGQEGESNSNREVEMTEQELAELREQIRTELLAEAEAQETTLAELREQVRGEVEAELEERFERRRGLVEFAEELCGGEAGLSAKVEDVVAALEGLPEEQVEAMQALLKSKVVDFTERGSSGGGEGR